MYVYVIRHKRNVVLQKVFSAVHDHDRNQLQDR